MTKIDRILELMKERGVKAVTLTTEAGLARSAISDWKKRKYEPSYGAIVKVAEYFSVSKEWLLTGEKNNHHPEMGLVEKQKEGTFMDFNEFIKGAIEESLREAKSSEDKTQAIKIFIESALMDFKKYFTTLGFEVNEEDNGHYIRRVAMYPNVSKSRIELVCEKTGDTKRPSGHLASLMLNFCYPSNKSYLISSTWSGNSEGLHYFYGEGNVVNQNTIYESVFEVLTNILPTDKDKKESSAS